MTHTSAIAWCPVRDLLAYDHADGDAHYVNVIDVLAGEPVCTFELVGPVAGIAWYPCGSCVVAIGKNVIYTWNVLARERVGMQLITEPMPTPLHAYCDEHNTLFVGPTAPVDEHTVLTVVSPDRQYIAMTNGDSIAMVDRHDDTLYKFIDLAGPIVSIGWSTSSGFVAAVNARHEMRIWAIHGARPCISSIIGQLLQDADNGPVSTQFHEYIITVERRV